MSKIRIITDSASDISVQDEREHNIKIIPFSVVLGDQVYTSRVDFTVEGFYDMMEASGEIPKTSQITSYQFEELFAECYEEGYEELILVLINSQGSATFQNAMMGKDAFYEEHEGAEDKMKITLHDSGSYTGAYGQLVVEAAIMLEEGADAAAINEFLSRRIPRRRVYFGMYDLTCAGKSGRIPTAAAFLGNTLGIKPIMKLADHEITTAAKVRGDKKLLKKVVDMTMADIEVGTPYHVVYAKNTECRDEMVEKMTKAIGYGPVGFYQVGSEVAANAGLHLAGVIFDTKEGV